VARKTIFVDDLTGKEIPDGEGGPVTFSIKGEFFELDLSEESQARLDKALAPFIEKANKVPAPQSVVSRTARSTTRTKIPGQGKDYLDAVRRWARDNGYEVADRGRIKGEIVEAYEAAHK
jgi:hypothetical protein